MALTPEAAAENLANAVAAVRAALGFAPSGPVPIERHGEYIRALSAYILREPSNYTEAAVANARRWANTADVELQRYTVTDAAGDFFGEVGNQALRIGEGAAAVGQGVVNTAKMMRWLLPIAALVVVGLFIWRRFGAATPAK